MTDFRKPPYPRPARPEGIRPQGTKPEGARPQGPRPQGAGSGARPPQRRDMPAKATPMRSARSVALDVLLDVVNEGAFASLALDRVLKSADIAPRDRALATEIAMGTIDMRVHLDYVLEKFLTKPTTDTVLRELLRMGAYQILFLDRVPDSAVCDEMVKLCKKVRPGLDGVVNGVLRNLCRQKEALEFPEEKIEALSVRYSYPAWIVEKLIEDYGDEAEKMLAYRPKVRHTVVRPNPMRMTDAEFEAYLTRRSYEWTPGIVPGCYRVIGAHMAGDPGFMDGLFTIQGESSYLCATLASAKAGQSVLDICAAPGGKTVAMAAHMQGTGRVYAWDLYDHRVDLIRKTASRMRLENIRPAARDATQFYPQYETSMDAVVVDAPCSGLGVLNSKPDIKYRLSQESLDEMVITQKSILENAARYVKVGGTLIYSTCTLLEKENQAQIKGFLASHPEYALSDLCPFLPEALKGRVKDNVLQLLPHLDDMEGFFLARMVRKGKR